MDTEQTPAEQEPDRPAPEPAPEPARIEARAVAIRRRRAWLLPATSLEVVEGEVTLAVGDPDDRHALLALAVAGRLAGVEGEVLVDGVADARRLQREVALVDVVGVTAPEPVLPVRAVVGEDLAMAGRRAWSRDVAAWLAEAAPEVAADAQLGDLEPAARVALMTRLALLRSPRFLVLALPERHGALPAGWWQVVADAAADGPGVLVTASPTAASHVAGRADRTAPIGPGHDQPTRSAQTEEVLS
ncbi:hypothetical protein [Nocardioides zeicaulis]|uniref:ABC transporter ATP-binding protein n=1 Tax=Nocardioides zeicaulis TaxID=1776857 RepID=A0ABV6E1Y2_9ACTN